MGNKKNIHGLSKLLSESIERSGEIIYEKKEAIKEKTDNDSSYTVLTKCEKILSDMKKKYDKETMKTLRTSSTFTISRSNKSDLDKAVAQKDLISQTEFILEYCKECAFSINAIYGHIARLELIYNKLAAVDAPHRIKITDEINRFSDSLGRWVERILGIQPALLAIAEKCSLTNDEMVLLIKHFFEGNSYEIVCKELFISDRKAFICRKKLIKALSEYFIKNDIYDVFEHFGLDHSYFES